MFINTLKQKIVTFFSHVGPFMEFISGSSSDHSSVQIKQLEQEINKLHAELQQIKINKKL